MERHTYQRTSVRGRGPSRTAGRRQAYGRRTRGRTPVRYRTRRYAPARGRPGSRPGRPGSRILLASGLAVAVVLGLAGFAVARARASACHATGDRIIWAQQESRQEGASSSPPADLLSRAGRAPGRSAGFGT